MQHDGRKGRKLEEVAIMTVEPRVLTKRLGTKIALEESS
jgi:hypothetical protein